MNKINNLNELQKLKEQLISKDQSQNNSDSFGEKVRIKVAMATCGIASGAREVMDYFSAELEKRSIEAVVTQVGCMGYCYAEPTVEVKIANQDPVVFGFVDQKKADEIIEKYIKNNETIEGVIPVNYETIDKI